MVRLPQLCDWNPCYLTTPLISVYPLVQIPTPQADGGIPYWWTSKSSFMGMDHEASPMLLKPTPVVTYSISKAQSIPLPTFTSPAIFSISFCSLSNSVYSFTRWTSLEIIEPLCVELINFLFYQKLCVVFRGMTMIPVVFCPQTCTGRWYKTQY